MLRSWKVDGINPDLPSFIRLDISNTEPTGLNTTESVSYW
jgi:hypothetical protein